jgi:DNA-binding transcriptional MocR family regulator
MFADMRENGKSHLREPVHMPAIVLRRDGEPLHRQICDQTAAEIRAGQVPEGARLPSTRVLAVMLGVSRNTALAAYDELTALDLIEGRQGSGVHVKGGALLPGLDLPSVLRAARYPARLVFLNDPDGNPLAVNCGLTLLPRP